MIISFINNLKKLSNIKFRFDLPKSKKILQYDEFYSDFLKKAIKKDFNIMPRRIREVYFWILIKQIIFFDFRFSTYLKNYIKYTSTKIVITLIDNDLDYYRFKSNIYEAKFISIQIGVRTSNTWYFKKKNFSRLKNLNCDHFFVHNKYVLEKYKKFIKSKYHILGSYKNNSVKVSKTKYKKSFLFIATGIDQLDKMRIGISHKLLILMGSYFLNSNNKIHILLKNKNSIGQKNEMEFYKRFFKSNCIFIKPTINENSYKELDKFENIIFTNTTLGYEAIARKKKVAVFSVNKDKIDKKIFGWPKKYLKEYSFFSPNKLTYSEIKRVLENIYSCNQENWEKKYYRCVKDLMYFDNENTQLINIINMILKKSLSR